MPAAVINMDTPKAGAKRPEVGLLINSPCSG